MTCTNFVYTDYILPFFYFSTPKICTIKDPILGLMDKMIKVILWSWVIIDLFSNELYLKTEIPSGYTTFWAESGDLINLQKINDIEYKYCDNSTYNYAYDTEDWLYTNISCIRLPYSEMYTKGEREVFFLTHFTENYVECKACTHENVTEKCITKIQDDYFTVGVEGMNFAFDHFYITSFEKGSNLGDEIKTGIDTYIKDIDGNEMAFFPKGDTITMNISEWLRIANINLEGKNEGTGDSKNHSYIENIDNAFNRLSGVEILVNVNFHNMESISGYTKSTCEIILQGNPGWASKGSSVSYTNHPNISDALDEYSYYDRYKYGIKFKFVVSGVMGEFNTNNLVNHLTSGIVLSNMSTIIVSLVILYSATTYGKKFKEFVFMRKSICKKEEERTGCLSNFNYCYKKDDDLIEAQNVNTNLDNTDNNLRNRKMSRWELSKTSFNYSDCSSYKKTINLLDDINDNKDNKDNSTNSIEDIELEECNKKEMLNQENLNILEKENPQIEGIRINIDTSEDSNQDLNDNISKEQNDNINKDINEDINEDITHIKSKHGGLKVTQI